MNAKIWITAALAAAGLTATACSSGSGGGAYGGGAGGGGTTPSAGGSTSAVAAPAAVTISVSGGRLVGADGKTLYFNTVDTASAIKCTGSCASLWPPVVGHPSVGGGLTAAKFGTAARPGGGMQVTFAGHPLYEFSGDSGPGMTNGKGIADGGGHWVVATPSGSTGQPASTPSSSSGGGNGGYGGGSGGYGYP